MIAVPGPVSQTAETTDTPDATLRPERTPVGPERGLNPAGESRGLFIVAVLAAVLGLGITLSFGYADHAPRPHGVRIAVAAPPRSSPS